MEETTPWFEGSILPARRGVYERQIMGFRRFAYWNGKVWFLSADNPDDARATKIESAEQAFRWRGLKVKP